MHTPKDFGSRSASRLDQTKASTGTAYLTMVEPDQRLKNRVGYYYGLPPKDYRISIDAIRKLKSWLTAISRKLIDNTGLQLNIPSLDGNRLPKTGG